MTGALAASCVGGRTITVGNSGANYGFNTGFYGSINSPTFLAATVTNLAWNGADLFFTVQPLIANSGWTTLTINGTAFARTSASYTDGGSYAQWRWIGVSNPFGTTVGVVLPWSIS